MERLCHDIIFILIKVRSNLFIVRSKQDVVLCPWLFDVELQLILSGNKLRRVCYHLCTRR